MPLKGNVSLVPSCLSASCLGQMSSVFVGACCDVSVLPQTQDEQKPNQSFFPCVVFGCILLCPTNNNKQTNKQPSIICAQEVTEDRLSSLTICLRPYHILLRSEPLPCAMEGATKLPAVPQLRGGRATVKRQVYQCSCLPVEPLPCICSDVASLIEG
jgi:hypothetical protein